MSIKDFFCPNCNKQSLDVEHSAKDPNPACDCGTIMERLFLPDSVKYMKFEGVTPKFHSKPLQPFDGGRRPNG